jgi:hypothetical protein
LVVADSAVVSLVVASLVVASLVVGSVELVGSVESEAGSVAVVSGEVSELKAAAASTATPAFNGSFQFLQTRQGVII